MAHVVQRGCGDSVLRDTQNPTGHSPERPAVGDPVWAGGCARWWGPWGPSQAQRSCESLRMSPPSVWRGRQHCYFGEGIRSHVWILILDCHSHILDLIIFTASVRSLIIHLERWPCVSCWHCLMHAPWDVTDEQAASGQRAGFLGQLFLAAIPSDFWQQSLIPCL